MDITEIIKILNSIPTGRSDYEFEHFFLEAYPTPARQIVAVMKEIEQLRAQIDKLEGSYDDSHIDTRRTITELNQKYQQAVAWYSDIDPDMRNAIISEYSDQESEYWSNYLGRQAALELMTIGRTTKDTMDKMTCLPVDAFEDAARICIRYAALIKNTTAEVEETLGVNTNGVPNG
jgi:hypothetical protein